MSVTKWVFSLADGVSVLQENDCCLEVFVEEDRMNSRVGLEVSIVDSFNKLLCDLYDLLFASCTQETGNRENSATASTVTNPNSAPDTS